MILPSRYAHERDAGFARRMSFSVMFVVVLEEIVTTLPFGRPHQKEEMRKQLLRQHRLLPICLLRPLPICPLRPRLLNERVM